MNYIPDFITWLFSLVRFVSKFSAGLQCEDNGDSSI